MNLTQKTFQFRAYQFTLVRFQGGTSIDQIVSDMACGVHKRHDGDPDE